MKPQPGTWPQWISVGVTVVTGVLVALLFYARSGLASSADLRDASVERTQLDRRVLVLERSAAASEKLAEAVTVLSTQVAVLVSRVESLERTVRVQGRRGVE